MAASSSSSSDKALVIIELKDPLFIETDIKHEDDKLISTWNLSPSILSSQFVKIQTDRNKLIQESSYFRSLLTGNFSESGLDSVSVHWNIHTFIHLLNFISGFPLDVSINTFIPLMEAALFFGVEALLLECTSWFSKASSTREFFTMRIPLVSVIDVWSFGLEHDIGCFTEQCTGYLARNFMLAMSCSSFVEIPYKLLSLCLEHPHLTVDSEKVLAEALLDWLECNTKSLEVSSLLIKDDYSDILKTVRVSLLPFWFATGKKWSNYLSERANKSISGILSLMSSPSLSLLHMLRDGDLESIRIRLTHYTERIDLSGCPQVTTSLLLFSVLPHKMNSRSKKILEESLIEVNSLDMGKYAVPQYVFPILSFEAVREVDISNCPRVHLQAAIMHFFKSFPSLNTLKASNCLYFKMTTLFQLVEMCPLLSEVYFAADLSPILPAQVSMISTNIDRCSDVDLASYKVLKERALSSNITKLILEGRTEIEDSDLINMSAFSGSLCYLNLKGCTSVTDTGISKLISKCLNLHSVVASDTYFGKESILALCSVCPSLEHPSGGQHGHSTSLASKLQKLHIGGCKSLDAISILQLMSHTVMLKSLSLRATSLEDDAVNNFLGSSLERLDISETMVSGVALALIVSRNPGLKLIKSRGCKRLCRVEDTLKGNDFCNGCSKGEKLDVKMGGMCNLEGVELGWGFSSLSLHNLGPALGSLRYLTVGLGASLSECALMLLPTVCPLLESLILNFQVISDRIVKCIVESSRQLKVLALCYCFGDLSPLSFHISMPNLRKLRLERVVPWITNDDLVVLTQSCTSLIELSLSGCTHLNSDSQQIISSGWPGLISIHLEDCGEVTSNGVSSLLNCRAMESLLLRHSGRGIQRNFIVDAATKMPLLRKVALDLCDAGEGGFESPSYANRYSLCIVRIARCKLQKCAFEFQTSKACKRPVHKETIVLEWNSKGLRTTVVEERV